MTQGERILAYMKQNESITPMEAFSELGITKLSTRIGELRQKGYKINDAFVDGKNRYGENVRYKKYWLAKV